MSMDLTTVFQTMPYVQNVAHAELVHPEIQQAVTQVLAQQFLAEREKQTQRIEKQDAMTSVQDDKRRQDKRQPGRRSRRAPTAGDETTQAANSTPFAGHIIDMKI
jgi:hypothetical protein